MKTMLPSAFLNVKLPCICGGTRKVNSGAVKDGECVKSPCPYCARGKAR